MENFEIQSIHKYLNNSLPCIFITIDIENAQNMSYFLTMLDGKKRKLYNIKNDIWEIREDLSCDEKLNEKDFDDSITLHISQLEIK